MVERVLGMCARWFSFVTAKRTRSRVQFSPGALFIFLIDCLLIYFVCNLIYFVYNTVMSKEYVARIVKKRYDAADRVLQKYIFN